MTQQQFNEAKYLQQKMEEKKEKLQEFQQGKITSLTVRIFNENKKEFEDKVYTCLPAAKLKSVMLDMLKADLSNCDFRFKKMFETETQPVS